MIAAPITHTPSTESPPYRATPAAARDAPQPVAPAIAKDAEPPAGPDTAGSFTAALADAEQRAQEESGRNRLDARAGATTRVRTRRHKGSSHANGRDASATPGGGDSATTPPAAVQPPAFSQTDPTAAGARKVESTATGRPGPASVHRGDSAAKSGSGSRGALAVWPAGATRAPAADTPKASAADPATSQTPARVRAGDRRQQIEDGGASAPANGQLLPPGAAATATAAAPRPNASSVAMAADTFPGPIDPDAGVATDPPAPGTPPADDSGHAAPQAMAGGAARSSPQRSPGGHASSNDASTGTARDSGRAPASESHSDASGGAPDTGRPTTAAPAANVSAGSTTMFGQPRSNATTAAVSASGAAVIPVLQSVSPAALLAIAMAPAPIALPATLAGASSTATANPPSSALPPATIDIATQLVGQPGWAQAIAQAIVTHAGAAGGRLRLQIQPPTLGPIDISLSIHNASATVQVIAQHPLTQAALQQAIPQLHALLGQQGVQLMHADVTAGQSGGQGRNHDAPPTPARVGTPTPGQVQAIATPARKRSGLVDDYA